MEIKNRIKELRRVQARALKPHPENFRLHPKRQREAMQAVLKEIGYADALLARELPDGSLALIDGHLRAETTPDVEVPVLVLDVTEEEARKLLLTIDPLAALAGTNDDVLASLLKSVDFDSTELDKFVERLARDSGIALADPAVEDEAPLPESVAISQPGDLWALGEQRLLCGDSTKKDDVERLLSGAAPRLMLTDPPYGVMLDMEWRDRAGINKLGPAEASYMKRAEGHKNTTISGDTKADWSDAFDLVPSLDTAYVWHASAFSVEVGSGLRRLGFNLSQQIIWAKPQLVISRQHYHWQHEPCWYARKKDALPFLGTRDQTTIWEAASPKMIMSRSNEEKVDHPTQKPVALYTRPIDNHLRKGDCFYEPFGGSGTAIVAAEQRGVRCLAMELDPRFVDVIVRRWQKFTGRRARNESRPNVEVA